MIGKPPNNIDNENFMEDPKDSAIVEKGSSNWREYRVLHLENGIQCLLVKDCESHTVKPLSSSP